MLIVCVGRSPRTPALSKNILKIFTENSTMPVKEIKRGLAIVNLTVNLAVLVTTGSLDKSSIFVGSRQVKSASKLVQLANRY